MIAALYLSNTSVIYCDSFPNPNVVEAAQVKNEGTAMISAGKVQTGDITNTTNIPMGLLDGPCESAAQAASIGIGAKLGLVISPKGSSPLARVSAMVAGAAAMGVSYALSSRLRFSSSYNHRLFDEIDKLKREQAAAAEAAASAKANAYAKLKESFPAKSMLEAEDLSNT